MSLPEPARIELPILQELEAIGGCDQPRYLYERLVRYFPQLPLEEIHHAASPVRSRWQSVVQRAGRQLADRGELRRERTRWELTLKGRHRLEAEALQVSLTPPSLEQARVQTLSHQEVQAMLVELGGMLGRHAEAEFEHYDVVWRDTPTSPRLSHVFEVQIHGSVDSALTRLKNAYDSQRSRPFLVVADERSARFAARRLSSAFHELWDVVVFLGVAEVEQLYRSLKAQEPVLEKLASRG